MKAKTLGGKRYKRFLRNARRKNAQAVRSVEVGFFETARYPLNVPVAAVAAWNEFGTRSGVPERPFFRRGIEASLTPVRETIVDSIDSKTLAMSPMGAGRVGEVVKGHVQQSITDLKTPPNRPATVRRKGSSNPLIDTGKMRNSVTYKIQ